MFNFVDTLEGNVALYRFLYSINYIDSCENDNIENLEQKKKRTSYWPLSNSNGHIH